MCQFKMNIKVILLFIVLFSVELVAQVGISTENPNPLAIDNVMLDINGKVIIRDLEIPDLNSNFKRIGVDENGVVVKMPNKPTYMAFFQSRIAKKYTDSILVSNFNSTQPFIVPWDSDADVVINQLFTIDQSDSSFAFIEDGIYEVSGVMNWGFNMGSSFVGAIGKRIAINLTLQYKKTTETAWTDLTTSRYIFTAGMLTKDYTASTIVTPPAIFNFNAGDKIRMIVKKAFGEDCAAFEVSKPTGSTISKQIKVLSL